MAINVTARLEKKKKQLDGMLAKRRTMEEQIRQIQEEMKGLTNERLKQWTDALQMELERKNSAIDLTCVPVEKVAEWLLSCYEKSSSKTSIEVPSEDSGHDASEEKPSGEANLASPQEEVFRFESAMQ